MIDFSDILHIDNIELENDEIVFYFNDGEPCYTRARHKGHNTCAYLEVILADLKQMKAHIAVKNYAAAFHAAIDVHHMLRRACERGSIRQLTPGEITTLRTHSYFL